MINFNEAQIPKPQPHKTMQIIDRLSYCSGTYAFWADHHEGPSSKGYEILSKVSNQYNPGPSYNGWDSLDETSREVYRSWCRKQSVECEYDTVKYALSNAFDSEDPCVEYFLSKYGSNTLEETCLVNYYQSDFVNIDMCYTRDLIEFYDRNETELTAWIDKACEAYGYTSTLQLLEGQTIETPGDMAAALVNTAMSYLAYELLSVLFPDK